MTASVHPQTASDVLEQARDALDGDTTSLGEFIDALGMASYTPLVLLPALMLVSPLSGVPGLSAICGLVIAAVTFQQMLNRSGPGLWLPGTLRRARLATQKVRRGLSWVIWPVTLLDRITRRRLHGLVKRPLVRLPQGICLCLGLAMPVMELIPFSSTIAGALVSILTMGIFIGDGLLVLAGLLVAAAIGGAFAVLI